MIKSTPKLHLPTHIYCDQRHGFGNHSRPEPPTNEYNCTKLWELRVCGRILVWLIFTLLIMVNGTVLLSHQVLNLILFKKHLSRFLWMGHCTGLLRRVKTPRNYGLGTAYKLGFFFFFLVFMYRFLKHNFYLYFFTFKIQIYFSALSTKKLNKIFPSTH